MVTTFATGLLGPEGLAFGPNGDLYVANNFDGVDEVTPTGQVTDIANGSMFDDPSGIAVDAAGNIYVANSGNGTVVKVTPAGVISHLRLRVQPVAARRLDLSMPPATSLSPAPAADAVDEVTPAGKVSTFVSGFESGAVGLAFDAAGNLYVGN